MITATGGAGSEGALSRSAALAEPPAKLRACRGSTNVTSVRNRGRVSNECVCACACAWMEISRVTININNTGTHHEDCNLQKEEEVIPAELPSRVGYTPQFGVELFTYRLQSKRQSQ